MISIVAFALVVLAMLGIERKRSYGQGLMFLSQVFWLWDSVQRGNLWLCVQSTVLGLYTIKIWWVWYKSDRGIK